MRGSSERHIDDFRAKYGPGTFVALSVVVALILYSHDLALRSWTNDELGTILISEMSPAKIMNVVKATDILPPTHYLLVHYWADLFGEKLSRMRFLDIIPVLVLLPFSFSFARKMFSDEAAAFSILLLLSSPTLLYYARMVRYYSWAVLFAFFSVSLFLEWVRTGSRRSQLLFVLATSLLGYLHYLTIALVIIVENLFLVMSYRRRQSTGGTVRQWIGMQVAVCVMLLPLVLWFTLPQFSHVISSASQTSYHSHGPVNWLGMVAAMLYPLYAFSFSLNLFPWEFVFTIPASILFLFVLAILYRFIKRNPEQVPLATSFILAPLAIIALAMFFTRISTAIGQSPAYALFALPFLITLVGGSLSSLTNKWLRYGALSGLILFNGISISSYFSYHTALCWDPNWREVAEYLKKETKPGDLIVANNPQHKIIRTSYISHYLHRPTVDVMENSTEVPPRGELSDGYREFVSILKTRQPRRVWIVVRNRLPGETILARNDLVHAGYSKVQTAGFWKNGNATRHFKDVLGRLSFLDFKAINVREYKISVILYQLPRD